MTTFEDQAGQGETRGIGEARREEGRPRGVIRRGQGEVRREEGEGE